MKLTHLFVCACLAFSGAAQASDFVVTNSSAASVSPGLMLKPDASIKLASGEAITLFGPSGLVEVKGPYSGQVATAAGATGGGASVVSKLLKRRKRISSLAASRSGGTVDGAATTEMLMLLSDGVWCVDGPAPDLFVRPEKTARVVTLVGSSGARHEMLWPADAATQSWPDGAPYTAGSDYTLMIGDIQMPVGLTLEAGAGAGDDGARLQGYLAAGCAAQADALMTQMSGG